MDVKEYAVGFNSEAHGRMAFRTGASSPMAAVEQVLNAEGAPASVVEWVRVRPTCDNCPEPATEGGEDGTTCHACARARGFRPLRIREWPKVSWKRETVEITVTVRVDADPDAWDLAYGTTDETRAADMRSWLDNQAREAVALVSDVAGEVTATVVKHAESV